jgi:lysophospholipase L1-like esterase
MDMVRKLTPVMRPVMKAKTRAIHADTDIPRPTDTKPARTPGLYPDRVLLLGNGALAGWGVTSHDQAIPGHLARALTSRTRHPAEVHLRMDHTVRITTITTLLTNTDITDFDAVVVVCGASDALQLLPEHTWDTAIQNLIGTLLKATPEPTGIIIVGIQPPSTVPVFHLTEGGTVDQQAELFNTITRQYCTGRVHFLPPPDLPRIGPQRAPQSATTSEEQRVSDGYRAWAEIIAAEFVRTRPRNPTTLT